MKLITTKTEVTKMVMLPCTACDTCNGKCKGCDNFKECGKKVFASEGSKAYCKSHNGDLADPNNGWEYITREEMKLLEILRANNWTTDILAETVRLKKREEKDKLKAKKLAGSSRHRVDSEPADLADDNINKRGKMKAKKPADQIESKRAEAAARGNNTDEEADSLDDSDPGEDCWF